MFWNNLYKYLTAVLLLLLMAGQLGSCRKDEGNYTYSHIDTIGITGINDSYLVSLGTQTTIHPVLTYESGANVNDSNFTFDWTYYTQSIVSGNRTTLYTGKNLDTILPLSIGIYNFYYTIKEKSTGITWQKKFRLEVTGSFNKNGWFVLNDVNGQSRLDYYADNPAAWNTYPTIYRNISSVIKDASTGEQVPLTGKPLSLAAYQNKDAIYTTYTYWLYVSTDKETVKINLDNGFTWNKIKYLFANETAFGEPGHMDYLEGSSLGGGGAYGLKDGDLYMYYYIYSLYGTPMNRLAGGSRFNIAPYLAFPVTSSMHAMFFDTDNKRFVRTQYTSTAATIVTGNGAGLDMANVGKDLVWMNYTYLFSGQVIALFKDNNNRFYLARISYQTSTSAPSATPISFTDITDKMTGLVQADRFALDQHYGYIFYTVGNKLYQYDMDGMTAKMVKDYGSRKISLLKVNKMTVYPQGSNNFNSSTIYPRMEAPGYSIIVGTYDEASPASSGTLDFFKAPQYMGDLTTYFSSFTGLGKVVDVAYTEKN